MSGILPIATNMRAGAAVVSAGLGVQLAGADEAFSFDGLTPTVPAVLTDSSTGTAAAAIAAGVGKYCLDIPLQLAGITGNVDVVTEVLLGHKFKLIAADFFVTTIASTAAKLATLNLEIGAVNVTGGAVALTTANCGTLGVKVAGTAITALNTGSATDVLSVEASGVTAFAEGNGFLRIIVQNMDSADAFASISDRLNDKGFSQAA